MGGAYGHMDHPYDVSTVTNGSELLKLFNQVKTLVEKDKAASVKLDGTNVSFKLVDGPVGKEFAVDRGSYAPIDIEGITIDRIGERWPPPEPGKKEHGMRPAVATLLTILNEALPKLQPVLEKMGMWNDPTRFLNTEYVSGTTNVTEYDEKFLAIHNLSQFYEATSKGGRHKGAYRPGAPRPTDPKTGKPIKASGREIIIDPSLIDKMVEILRPVAAKYDYQVYGAVPTTRLEGADIDFNSILSEPFSVLIANGNADVAGSEDKVITKTLKDWLQEAPNPGYSPIRLRNGKKLNALHGNLYLTILNQTAALLDVVEDADVKKAIYGAVLFHATRMLGNAVLKGLTSPMGDLVNHEGIVIRDDKLSARPFKITGDFMVKNRTGGFGTDKPSQTVGEGPIEEEEIENTESEIIAIPGGFKPPHKGHLSMINHYLDSYPNAEVVILAGSEPRQADRGMAFGKDQTEAIFDLYKRSGAFSDPNRVRFMFNLLQHMYADNARNRKKGLAGQSYENPFKDVFALADQHSGPVGIGYSDKDPEDASRGRQFAKFGAENGFDPGPAPGFEGMSATTFRNAIEDRNLAVIRQYLPEGVDIDEFLGLFTVAEMSSGAGGSNVGYGAPLDDDEQTRNLATEAKEDIDAVMKLIMERGILR